MGMCRGVVFSYILLSCIFFSHTKAFSNESVYVYLGKVEVEAGNSDSGREVLLLDRGMNLNIVVSDDSSINKVIEIRVCKNEQCDKFLLSNKNKKMSYRVEGTGEHNIVYFLEGEGQSITFLRAVEFVPDDDVFTSLQPYMRQISSVFTAKLGLDDFEVKAVPCGGEVNAFSHPETGDISLCVETLVQVFVQNKMFFLEFLLMHELGHTFLTLIDFPGLENEELADEFAAYVLANAEGYDVKLRKMIEEFEKQDPYAEAAFIKKNGAMHPMSFQRAQIIRDVLSNLPAYHKKWGTLLHIGLQGGEYHENYIKYRKAFD